MNKRVVPKPEFANLTDADVRLALSDTLDEYFAAFHDAGKLAPKDIDSFLEGKGFSPQMVEYFVRQFENSDPDMGAIKEECTRLMQAYLDDPEALAARATTGIENVAFGMYERWQANKKRFPGWGKWD
jgi:hypothetical protein